MTFFNGCKQHTCYKLIAVTTFLDILNLINACIFSGVPGPKSQNKRRQNKKPMTKQPKYKTAKIQNSQSTKQPNKIELNEYLHC
ncbi:hypothetical protein L596_020598 [Steinernema carpocapsae]|uniref:Uncharacterized protein n=1 Tax=Steinernema carpocapsae TaxID=34508 RepID=A0A4V6XW03_STECR|nr:hypothetical protein L596_020598 [Steinernema carpocapsae]